MIKFLKRVKHYFIYLRNCTKQLKAKTSYDSIPYPPHRSSFLLLKTLGDKNKDKTFYLIDTPNFNNYGYFAIIRYIASSMIVCLKTGAIPHVVVRKSRYNNVEGDNMFENYFIQPSGFTTEEVMQSYNVIIHNVKHIDLIEELNTNHPNLTNGYVISDEYINLMGQICNKYIKLRSDIEEKLSEQINNLLSNKEKTIGIHYRGNAFKIGLKYHPVVLTIEDYYPFIDKCLENGFEKIFLATDEEQTIEKVREKYGDKVLFYNDTFRSSNGFDIHEQVIERENNNFLIGYEALRDMLTLSYCGALVCGLSQLSIMARIFKSSRNEKYQFLQLINKGFNEKTNKKVVNEYDKKRRKM